ncbi:hypothetical protein [Nocardioides pakistanensis]
MEREQEARRRIGTGVAAVVAVVLGAALLYLGITMVRFGIYAIDEGETFIGVASLVLGTALGAVPVAVLVSQVRAMLRRRG